MRLFVFLEACVQLVGRREPDLSPCGCRKRGVTGLITHHKVAVAPPQPRPRGRIEAVNGQGIVWKAIWPNSRRSASESGANSQEFNMNDGIRPLIAGNWKMNGLKASMAEFDAMLAGAGAFAGKADLLVCPPATLISSFAEKARGKGVAVGAQDCHPNASGAHPGDLSAEML